MFVSKPPGILLQTAKDRDQELFKLMQENKRKIVRLQSEYESDMKNYLMTLHPSAAYQGTNCEGEHVVWYFRGKISASTVKNETDSLLVGVYDPTIGSKEWHENVPVEKLIEILDKGLVTIPYISDDTEETPEEEECV